LDHYRWRGCDRRCDHDRGRHDDRQWQPEIKAEADSGVCGHCSRTDKRGDENHFCFHNFVQGILPFINLYGVLTVILHCRLNCIIPSIKDLQQIRNLIQVRTEAEIVTKLLAPLLQTKKPK
jgi:hypothetical protein